MLCVCSCFLADRLDGRCISVSSGVLEHPEMLREQPCCHIAGLYVIRILGGGLLVELHDIGARLDSCICDCSWCGCGCSWCWCCRHLSTCFLHRHSKIGEKAIGLPHQLGRSRSLVPVAFEGLAAISGASI